VAVQGDQQIGGLPVFYVVRYVVCGLRHEHASQQPGYICEVAFFPSPITSTTTIDADLLNALTANNILSNFYSYVPANSVTTYAGPQTNRSNSNLAVR